jgi:hypothetical protein
MGDAAQAERNVVRKKTPLLRHFMLKMIILPRQSRDKHRKNSKKEAFFLQGGRRAAGADDLVRLPRSTLASERKTGRPIPLFESRN